MKYKIFKNNYEVFYLVLYVFNFILIAKITHNIMFFRYHQKFVTFKFDILSFNDKIRYDLGYYIKYNMILTTIEH